MCWCLKFDTVNSGWGQVYHKSRLAAAVAAATATTTATGGTKSAMFSKQCSWSPCAMREGIFRDCLSPNTISMSVKIDWIRSSQEERKTK